MRLPSTVRGTQEPPHYTLEQGTVSLSHAGTILLGAKEPSYLYPQGLCQWFRKSPPHGSGDELLKHNASFPWVLP